jgi:DNA-directed RNA polymerase subunit M/transcription elongation factor TFIIS
MTILVRRRNVTLPSIEKAPKQKKITVSKAKKVSMISAEEETVVLVKKVKKRAVKKDSSVIYHIRTIAVELMLASYKSSKENLKDYESNKVAVLDEIKKLESLLYNYLLINNIATYNDCIGQLSIDILQPEFRKIFAPRIDGQVVFDAYTKFLIFGNCKTFIDPDVQFFQSSQHVLCAEDNRGPVSVSASAEVAVSDDLDLNEEEIIVYEYLREMSLKQILGSTQELGGDIECNKCGMSDKVKSIGLQTRSIDEGETIYSRCSRCRKFWKN